MLVPLSFFFFFNDTATTEIYTLSLHDALPISVHARGTSGFGFERKMHALMPTVLRSEEHTSELQSRLHLVCRLLLEKKKKPLHRPDPSLESNSIPDRPCRFIGDYHTQQPLVRL